MKIYSFVFLFTVLVLSALNASAADIFVTWQANIETDLKGYKLYYGNEPYAVAALYPMVIDVGNVTSYSLPVTVLGNEQTFYMAISAYDQTGNEGAVSVELNSFVPSLTTDSDNDGVTDLNEMVGGSNPNSPIDNLPIANAGSDQNVSAATVTLNGTASSDPNSDSLTYSWRQIAGSAVTFLNPLTATPSFNPSGIGTYIFSLTVSDGKASSQEDSVSIVVSNSAPIANAGANQLVLPGTLTLDGTGSSDVDGDLLAYSWSQTLGDLVTLSSTAIANPIFTSFNAGLYEFALVVTAGGQISQTAVTEVSISNVAPQADAGAKQTVSVGTTVNLHGSGLDSNKDSLSFSWKQLRTDTSLPVIILSNNNIAEPAFTSSQSGAYQFELVVDDGLLVSIPDVVDIVVNGLNSVPTADAGLSKTVMVNTEIFLDGSGSSDSDEDVLTFNWVYKGSLAVTLNNSLTTTPSFIPTEVGVYTFELTVDDGINISLPETVTVTVNDPLYTVPVADAGAGQKMTIGSTVTLGGAASSAYDNLPLSYSWKQVEGLLVSLSNDQVAAPTFIADYLGVLKFELVVNDGRQASRPDYVSIVVENKSNKVPVANAGGKQVVELVNGKIFLDGAGSYDLDGDTLQYFWSQKSGPSVVLSSDNVANPFFVPNIAQTYEFELVVSDGTYSSIADIATVVINSINNQKPVAEVGGNQHVAIDTVVSFDGTGSSDGDNDLLTYLWMQDSGPIVTLTGADSVVASFTPTSEGIYRFSLVVNDGTINSLPDQLTVYVNDRLFTKEVFTSGDGESIIANGAGFASIELSIPQGSVLENSIVSIGESYIDVSFNQDTEELISHVVSFEPHDINLEKPVTVRLSFDFALDVVTEEQIIVKSFDQSTNKWSRVVVADWGERFVTVNIHRLSKLAVGLAVSTDQVVDTEIDDIKPQKVAKSGGGCGFIKPTGGSGLGGGGGGMMNFMVLLLPLVYSYYRRLSWASRGFSQLTILFLGLFM